MKYILLVVAILFSNSLQAKAVEKDPATYYEGVIIAEEGTVKSYESYCYGDHFVLQSDKERYTLSSKINQDFKKFVGAKVRISGGLVTKVRKCEDGMPCPINYKMLPSGEIVESYDNECEYLEVKTIDFLDNKDGQKK